jgi:hypothetical protein
MPYLYYLARALVAVVFVWAGAAKLRDLHGFERYVRELRVLPFAPSRPVAYGLAVAELAAGGLTAAPWTATIGLGLAVIQLLVLSLGIAVLLRRGEPAECACFGRRRSPLGAHHLFRNGVVALTAAAGLAAPAGPTPQWPGIAIAVAAGLIGAVLVASWDDIADLFINPSAAPKGQPHAISGLGHRRTGPTRRDPTAVHLGDPAAAANPR